MYEGNSISKLQIQVANYVFELSAVDAAKDIHKKRTTQRCSIMVHVFRGAAIL
jgi:hypothetical protein